MSAIGFILVKLRLPSAFLLPSDTFLFPVEPQLRGCHPLVFLKPTEDVREVALSLLEQQVQRVFTILLYEQS